MNYQLSINTLRALSIEQIEAANSGHPGLPMGAAPMAYALWTKHLNITPTEPKWVNRDRFVLSAGHGSALLYSLLHVAGFDVTIEDLKQFRQLGSKTPGHPEVGHTQGVEATTGPLGQGIAQAVGMALAETHTAAIFNTEQHKLIDHYTYALVGDGDLMEGISYEAISFAGRQKLNKLIVLYDSNDISLDGDLNMAFNEDIKKRFESQNWHYLRVEDGNDVDAISKAIEEAKAHTQAPTIIEIKTVIGYGSPLQGTSKVHGAPLGSADWATTKEYYGWENEAFTVPEEAAADFKLNIQERGLNAYEEWNKVFEDYKASNPEKAAEFEAAFNGELPEGFETTLEYVEYGSKADATRNSNGRVIQKLSEAIPYFWGGSADLSGSNKTMVSAETDFMPENRAGRNIWFGVREFAMAAIMNGVQLHGGTRVYGGTFFVFTDYLKAAVRLSAISNIPVTYVMTHDSIAVGEDGPTHEPIEQLAAFRALPNLNTIRPADENETIAAWKIAVESKDRPTMLVLTRQNVPVLDVDSKTLEAGVRKGAYVVSPAKGDVPSGILLASGSEVSLAVEAQKVLAEKGHDVSVVSMPAMNLFDEQSKEYRETVLPNSVRNRLSIEMGATFGWAKYVGLDGVTIGIDRFGSSGKGEEVVADYGFTVENIVEQYLTAFN